MSTDALEMADLWAFARWARVKPPRDIGFDEFYELLKQKTKKMDRPTIDVVKFARRLGLKIDLELHPEAYVTGLVRATITKNGKAIMDNNMALRKDNVIMHGGVPHKITQIALLDGQWMFWLSSMVRGTGRRWPIKVDDLADVRLATPEEMKVCDKS